ncbi:hypothetical protein CDAR_618331 [Caerostris darwini]|uniref:Uncharacterized protein n=1 Tax=Caerostris darwini TaxID=1538125 RepID=A0AAV4SVB3_9ARAC|nr:hypothetical protein CDAR_618331 [Caerostris darwini]
MAEIINRVAEVAKNTKFLTTESINVMSKLRLGRRLAFSPRLQSQCLIGGLVHIYAGGGSMLQVFLCWGIGVLSTGVETVLESFALLTISTLL